MCVLITLAENVRNLLPYLNCPECAAELAVQTDSLKCSKCAQEYPIHDGIPVFTGGLENVQDIEQKERDSISSRQSVATALDEVSRHHFMPQLEKEAHAVLGKSGNQPIIDLGCGWAWPWLTAPGQSPVICIDFSLDSLLLAKKLLEQAGKRGVYLVCASAEKLPLQADSCYGLWSVQVLQHLQPPLLDKTLSEIERVLVSGGPILIRWLNYSLSYRLSCLLRRTPSEKERISPYYLKRLTASEYYRILAPRFDDVRIGRDELLFQPSLRMTHRSRTIGYLDRTLSSLPGLGTSFCNQLVGRAKNR